MRRLTFYLILTTFATLVTFFGLDNTLNTSFYKDVWGMCFLSSFVAMVYYAYKVSRELGK